MLKMKPLLKFLFEDSQETAQLEEGFAGMFEDLASLERLEVKKQPLESALKSLGVDTSNLELSPSGYEVVFDSEDDFNKTMTTLVGVEAVNKLAELGWVVANSGDISGPGTMALPKYKIKFLEVYLPEPSDAVPGANDSAALDKLQGRMQTYGNGSNATGKVESIDEELPDPTINEAVIDDTEDDEDPAKVEKASAARRAIDRSKASPGNVWPEAPGRGASEKIDPEPMAKQVKLKKP